MPKKIISFALSEKSIEQIDKTSKALGMSRSELIELLIKKGFHFSEEIEASVNKISELQKKTKERIQKRRG